DRVHPYGYPELRPESERAQPLEPRGRDTGDGELRTVDPDGPSGDRGIAAEAPLPAVVAQHDEGIGALRRVGCREESADGWMHPEHGEVVPRDHLTPDQVGRAGGRGAGNDEV